MLSKTLTHASTFQKAIALFVPLLLFRVFFSLTVGLIDDEAYHWSWAKELALSYYDHPAFVAWMEALSTAMFGDTLLGVRLPAFLFYVGTVVMAWKLAREMFDEWTAHAVAFLVLFTPLWGIAGYVASPEPFFMFFWISAAWVFWQSIRSDQKKWPTKKTWLWLGLIMGLGLNSKFIMALLAPGFAIFLLMTPGRRKELISPWPWTGALLATLICLPIFIWNDHAGWPGFKYQFHDRHAGESFSAERWLVWWAAQWIFMTPFVYILLGLSFVRSWFLRKDPRWRFIFALALPSITLFGIQPFFADYKPHWSGPAYLILAIGACALWASGLTIGERRWIRPRSKIWTAATAGLLLLLNIFVYSTFATPWLPKAHRFFNPDKTWETTWDFSNEFTGWEELGHFVNTRQREIHAETGRRPFIAALRYETTAQTYWGTKQKTYQMAFTRSHYTVIQNMTNDFGNMLGLDALVVTTEKYPADPSEWGRFDKCTPQELKTHRGAEHARTFTVWHCLNFQGVLK